MQRKVQLWIWLTGANKGWGMHSGVIVIVAENRNRKRRLVGEVGRVVDMIAKLAWKLWSFYGSGGQIRASWENHCSPIGWGGITWHRPAFEIGIYKQGTCRQTGEAYGDNLGNWAVTRHRGITVPKEAQTHAALTANWPAEYFYKWQQTL